VFASLLVRRSRVAERQNFRAGPKRQKFRADPGIEEVEVMG
jgi:hypothetical protein